jgi:hypothetical protein
VGRGVGIAVGAGGGVGAGEAVGNGAAVTPADEGGVAGGTVTAAPGEVGPGSSDHVAVRVDAGASEGEPEGETAGEPAKQPTSTIERIRAMAVGRRRAEVADECSMVMAPNLGP